MYIFIILSFDKLNISSKQNMILLL